MKIEQLTDDERAELTRLQDKQQAAIDAENTLAGRIDSLLGGYQGRRVIRVWPQLKALVEDQQ